MTTPATSEPGEPKEPQAATAPAPPSSVPELAQRMAEEASRIGIELDEVELLITQAKSEATRHEARRATASDKLGTLIRAAASSGAPPPDTVDLNGQLVLLTKRAALMESQVDVLEGKHRALVRFRDALTAYAEALAALPGTALAAVPTADGKDQAAGRASTGAAKHDAGPTRSGVPIGSLQPGVSRLLLDAQEDMRRDIARAMHDGPAQSLTNIVLQAQIVDYLVANDPAKASGEVRQLVAMVQQTLDATKSFIFDVRPMVLDDLGLVPTLRRAARDHGRRAGIPVEFESYGQDRRLPMDVESGLFRMADEALAAYLGARAERVSLKLDWADQVEIRITASRATAKSGADLVPEAGSSADLPPALVEMMEERRADARDRAKSAQQEAIVNLPASTWREIQGRAAILGIEVELSADGSELRLMADLPPVATESG
jgi:two-component system sensor histidine kinase DegS